MLGSEGQSATRAPWPIEAPGVIQREEDDYLWSKGNQREPACPSPCSSARCKYFPIHQTVTKTSGSPKILSLFPAGGAAAVALGLFIWQVFLSLDISLRYLSPAIVCAHCCSRDTRLGLGGHQCWSENDARLRGNTMLCCSSILVLTETDYVWWGHRWCCRMI